MAGEGWQQTKVEEMIRRGVLALNDGYRVRNVELGPVGIPFVRGGDIGDGGINTSVEDHIRPEFANRVQSKLTRPFDVAFITKGTVGRVGIVRPGQPTSVFAPQVCYWRSLDPEQLEPRFLFYILTSAEFQANLDAVKTHGSMVADYVSMTDQRDFRLTFPPIREQRAIAAVLGALDDKIELNRRMNATLEAMARALFQSWFVDFDPVRAKLDGRPPAALDPSTAALFPATFEDSPLGRIPKGWETSTVGAKLSTVLGGTPSRAKPENWEAGTVAWINSGKTNEFRIIDPSEWITKEALKNSATKLLPRRTTVLAITGATLGQVSIAEIECCANQSVVAIPASEQFPTEFIYPWIEENIEKLIASQTGGAQQHINKGNVEELALLCPDRRVVAAYQTKAKPLFDQIAANCFQSRTLATLRDTLLPKLLSGALDVSRIPKVGAQWPRTCF
jgi:type I restriction enzyme, S subunit